MKNMIKISIAVFSACFSIAIFADEVRNTNSTTTVTNSPSSTVSGTTTTNTTTTTTVNNIDDEIVTAIYARYAKDSALIGTNLSVKSVNGVVTIYGIVVSQSQADEAVIVAKSIPGVKDARSAINVTTNPTNNRQSVTPNY